MKNQILFTAFLILLNLPFTLAQELKKPISGATSKVENAAIKSPVHSASLYKQVNHLDAGDKWAISVRPTFSRKHSRDEIQAIKESKLQEKLNSFKPSEEIQSSPRAVYPVIGINFEANWSIEGTPPDNTIAISNGGFIVTANNDGIEYYNSSGNNLYFDYWTDFFNDNSLTGTIYDPRVIYDSGEDRFVLVVLHGTNPGNSKVLVCFSQTNNPQDGWWVYTLSGNPLNNNCWFDYPSLGVSTNEIYITGNLFQGNNFNQAVIFQIEKEGGYEGNNIDWQYWSDLSTDPYEAFSLVPASYGHSGNYGPGIYLVSNESGGHDKIRLWDLTDDLIGTPAFNSYAINTTAYEVAANALQSGSTDELDNGDCRIQNAFYLDGIVHFVFHSDIGEGWNGINYNRLSLANSSIQSSTFGLQGSYDYSYPAVIPFSTSSTDRSVMIAFLRSSEETYPQLRVVNCDHTFNWSPSTLVKDGETFVDFLSGNERWGDYTGIARKQNSSSGRIWLAGAYGADISSQQIFNTYKTWVAEVYGGAMVGTEEMEMAKDFTLFPNPTYDLLHITFTVQQPEPTTIELLDMQGKLIKLMYHDTPRAGENKLIFNQGALSAGSYLVSIKTNTKILKNETIIIAE